MKKVLALLLAVLMLASFGVCAAAEETVNEDILLTEKEMDFYMDDPEEVEAHTVFFPEDSDVPYVSLRVDGGLILPGMPEDSSMAGMDWK